MWGHPVRPRVISATGGPAASPAQLCTQSSLPAPSQQPPWRPYERETDGESKKGGRDRWGGEEMGRKAGRRQNPGGRGQRGREDFPEQTISGPHHLHRALLSLPTSSSPCLLAQISPLAQACLLLRTLPPKASSPGWVLFLEERSFILSKWLRLGKESSPLSSYGHPGLPPTPTTGWSIPELPSPIF